jgi:hypothetical protein
MVFSNDSEQYELVGVTGYRSACTTEGSFTRVTPFVSWILTILNAGNYKYENFFFFI